MKVLKIIQAIRNSHTIWEIDGQWEVLEHPLQNTYKVADANRLTNIIFKVLEWVYPYRIYSK